MAAFNFFNCFTKDLAEKKHNLSSDVLKFMLSNTLPLAANAVKGDITEIAAGYGYSAGGLVIPQVSGALAGNIYQLTVSNVTLTASGGQIGPFRYVAVYNDTAAAKNLIGWLDYGIAWTLNAAESFRFDVSAYSGLMLKVQVA
jgi:hypothetical protein